MAQFSGPGQGLWKFGASLQYCRHMLELNCVHYSCILTPKIP
jgi:hypothetical protein